MNSLSTYTQEKLTEFDSLLFEDARLQTTGEHSGSMNLWAILLGVAGFASALWAILR